MVEVRVLGSCTGRAGGTEHGIERGSRRELEDMGTLSLEYHRRQSYQRCQRHSRPLNNEDLYKPCEYCVEYIVNLQTSGALMLGSQLHWVMRSIHGQDLPPGFSVL
jgi:hypothetical protein